MPSDSAIMDRVHLIDKTQGKHAVKIDNLESWVGDIHKTLKDLDSKVKLGTGILIGVQVAIQLIFKFWEMHQ